MIVVVAVVGVGGWRGSRSSGSALLTHSIATTATAPPETTDEQALLLLLLVVVARQRGQQRRRLFCRCCNYHHHRGDGNDDCACPAPAANPAMSTTRLPLTSPRSSLLCCDDDHDVRGEAALVEPGPGLRAPLDRCQTCGAKVLSTD